MILEAGNLRKFYTLSAKEKQLFGEAVMLGMAAKLMLLLFPLRVCISTMGKASIGTEADRETLLAIRMAIRRANRLAFWKNRCIVQSITARWMLRRRKISSVLTFGVMHDTHDQLIAHAWLKAGDVEIVERGGDFLPLKNL